MVLDRSFIELNRASSTRLHSLATRLSKEELMMRVGEEWTVGVTLAHMAFWDLRVMQILDATERNGKLCAPEIDISVNDIMSVLLAAIPPRLAANIAFQTAEALDEMIERFPMDLLEQIYARNERWVVRALHRNHHVDAIEAALRTPGEK
jgi:hypothetical protein